jgi:hypothetical protein
VIALGLAIELLAAGLVVVGLLLGDQRATVLLWSSVAAALVGLAVVMEGVRRARPPRRPGISPSPPAGASG